MKRTLVVLALMAFSAVGCRAVSPRGNCDCGEPCHIATSQMAPRPVECGDACGYGGYGGQGEYGQHGGNLADTVANCQACQGGGEGACFGRHCSAQGGGYGCGPYDCSPCSAGHWGCNGFGRAPGVCGRCARPGPGCVCSSGDQQYQFAPGPPVGQVAYPYYTVRGPRDFLLNNPPPLGPY